MKARIEHGRVALPEEILERPKRPDNGECEVLASDPWIRILVATELLADGPDVSPGSPLGRSRANPRLLCAGMVG